MKLSQRALNDHRLIHVNDDGKIFTPADALALHSRSRQWLAAELSRNVEGATATVVVTHHLPHKSSIDPKFAGDPLNVAFASDLSDLAEHGGAEVWIHGHTHSSCDYVAGSTRVVCNPKGYGPSRGFAHAENRTFDKRLIIEVGAEHQ